MICRDLQLGHVLPCCHGVWRQFNYEGKMTLEGHYEHGKRVGRWRGFYPEGALQYEGSFNELGQGDGEWITYRDDESIESRGTYLDGARVGVWGWWHADG